MAELVAETQYGTAAKANSDARGIPVVRMNNLTPRGSLDLTDLKHVELDGGENRFLLRHGDILFNRTNSPELVGKTAVWDRADDEFAYAGYLVRVRTKREIAEPRYVSAWFNSAEMKRTLRARAKPSINMANISASELLKFDVPLPPLPEQRRIADILDQADTLRTKRRAALAQLNTLAQAIFLEMFGDPVVNPKGWPEATLEDVLESMQYGPRFPDENYVASGTRIVRITDLDDSGNLDFGAMPHLALSAAEIAKHQLRPGDVIFARSGATVGKVALIDEGSPPCVAGAYFIVMRFGSQVTPEYARHVLRSDRIRAMIVAKSRQAAQQNFSGPGLRSLPMMLTPIAMQRTFEARTRAVRSEIRRGRSSLAHLDALFASLQHRAFRGEL